MAKMKVWARVGMSFTVDAESREELENKVRRAMRDVQQLIEAAGCPAAIEGDTYIPMNDSNELLIDDLEIFE